MTSMPISTSEASDQGQPRRLTPRDWSSTVDRFRRASPPATVLRRTFATQQKSALQALHAHLPPGFTVTQPQGGYFLWLEFPEHVDAIDVHRKALEQGFSIAPGPIFSARREFAHCLRLNYGHEWTAASERAIKSLGAIVRS